MACEPGWRHLYSIVGYDDAGITNIYEMLVQLPKLGLHSQRLGFGRAFVARHRSNRDHYSGGPFIAWTAPYGARARDGSFRHPSVRSFEMVKQRGRTNYRLDKLASKFASPRIEVTLIRALDAEGVHVDAASADQACHHAGVPGARMVESFRN